MEKNILGLDLGTNSIGWAVVGASVDEQGKEQLNEIKASGSRIIPMDASVLGDFNKGNSISQTASRTKYRSARRLRERTLLRRERLHRVLDLLGFLPEHYANNLNRYGKFLNGCECKLPWRKGVDGAYEFIFKNSFNEMLLDLAIDNPELISENKKVPYDWTIYYLRKKALTQKIKKEELAWILLNFNQKRGYYQLRGEEDESLKRQEKFYALKVVKVEDSGSRKGKNIWYDVHLENGMIYHRASSTPLEWEGKTKEFIVTTDLNEDGTFKKDKDGNIKRSLRAPSENDWTLLKKKTENDIDESKKTIGAYIYDTLRQKNSQKIRGKLIRTIERKYYKDELKRILRTQIECYDELQDKELYAACVQELYPNNDAHVNNIITKDFNYLFVEDIIFYQRPLKSKKSLIENCPYERNYYVDKETGEVKFSPIKCIAKSHPLFQEFRLWQFISNVHIYQKQGINSVLDEDITHKLLASDEDYVQLFKWLNDKEKIDQKTFLKYPKFNLKTTENYRWNYVEEKVYPCNETRAQILTRLKKVGIQASFLSNEKTELLWHILYSVEDKQEIEQALRSFARKNSLKEDFVNVFKKFPPFKKEYGAYSAKAIKKLLPLMRRGTYWDASAIDVRTRERIEKIINGEYDETIRQRVREKAIYLTDIEHFQALPVWLATYIVYDRHSEAKNITRWQTPSDIDDYLNSFKQHSLRNPIVEQVLTETLRTVRDIWKQVGSIDEIHVELGREMKNTAEKRAKMTRRMLENENTNLRIKTLLTQFLNPEFEIDNVRPYSSSQQEILHIYEEDVLNNVSELPEEISAILDKFKQSDVNKYPSRSEILRYKLWLEQKYISPYTGEVISLGKLFTPAYEIEHIIPQSRYFDDSFTNKVICEAEVNKLKSNDLGYEFIKKHSGEKVFLGSGKTVEIFTVEAYERFVQSHYSYNREKMKKLFLEDIPEHFIARQLNDSRYISKITTLLLSNIVREEGEQETLSKNVILCTGSVTDRLKRDWGINDVWNNIILPRFIRLNKLKNTTQYTTKTANNHEIPTIPLENQKGFNKKRIDHRHHAMDAIVIACANRNIVNYLNNQAASKNAEISRHDLQVLLCSKRKIGSSGDYTWLINKPWETFTQDVFTILQNIIVSFKQNLRVINKTTNYYQHYADGRKVLLPQRGINWAIRKSMHKDTVFGEVNLRLIKTVSLREAIKDPTVIVERDFKKKLIDLCKLGYDLKKIKEYFENEKETWQDINLSKIKVYYFSKESKERYFATRKPIDTTFDERKIKEEITDSGIRKIMLRHLEKCNNDPNIAFSPDGIEKMNGNIKQLNDGKNHQPIYKIRWFEKANKFAVGTFGNKSSKFVEADKGTNLFYVIYETESADSGTIPKRTYATIPLNVVIERQKQGLPSVPQDENGKEPIYVLSPNDLVYVPTTEEILEKEIHQPIDRNRIYKVVSSTGNRCFFIKAEVANCIVDKVEFSSMNKMERTITEKGEMIKEVCILIKVDRLGNVIKIGN